MGSGKIKGRTYNLRREEDIVKMSTWTYVLGT